MARWRSERRAIGRSMEATVVCSGGQVDEVEEIDDRE